MNELVTPLVEASLMLPEQSANLERRYQEMVNPPAMAIGWDEMKSRLETLRNSL